MGDTVWVMDASGAIAGYRGGAHAYRPAPDEPGDRYGAICGHLLVFDTLFGDDRTDTWTVTPGGVRASDVPCDACREALNGA